MAASAPRRRSRRVATASGIGALLAASFVVLTASSARSVEETGTIVSYDVQMSLRLDGSMRVQETIDYDFGDDGVHDIVRTIPVRFAYDEDHDRVFPIRNVDVTSPTGAQLEVHVTEGSSVTVRIGVAARAAAASRQTFVIGYDVTGAITPLADHEELYWNVVGSQWPVPIRRVTAEVEGPQPAAAATCFKGYQGSTRACTSGVLDTGTAQYAASGLDRHQGVTVVASFAPGTFPDAELELEEVWTFSRAFAVTPLTVGSSLLVLLLLIGAPAWSWLRARRRPEDAPSSAEGASAGGSSTQALPDALRPAHLGPLADGRTHILDLTATLLDLAVHGSLRFVDRGRSLERVPDAGSAALRPYEVTVLDAVFAPGDRVAVAELEGELLDHWPRVQEELYRDLADLGWMHGRPATVRRWWSWWAGAVMLAGFGLTLLLGVATVSGYGLVGVAVAFAGAVLLGLAGFRPVRTAEGDAVLGRALSLRTRLAHGDPRFADESFLAFAVVLGVLHGWAEARAAASGEGAAEASEPEEGDGVTGWGGIEDLARELAGAIAAGSAFGSRDSSGPRDGGLRPTS